MTRIHNRHDGQLDPRSKESVFSSLARATVGASCCDVKCTVARCGTNAVVVVLMQTTQHDYYLYNHGKNDSEITHENNK